jgi:hypothetical protein
MSVEVVKGSPGEIFAVFLKLGLTSFGGPIAHLGYFRDELVVRRKWLNETAYADLGPVAVPPRPWSMRKVPSLDNGTRRPLPARMEHGRS